MDHSICECGFRVALHSSLSLCYRVVSWDRNDLNESHISPDALYSIHTADNDDCNTGLFIWRLERHRQDRRVVSGGSVN